MWVNMGHTVQVGHVGQVAEAVTCTFLFKWVKPANGGQVGHMGHVGYVVITHSMGKS